MNKNVEHPTHYNQPGRKECIVEMEEKYGAEATAIFCLTNSYKYLYRAVEKLDNPIKQDIDKAKWYFEYVNKLIGKYEILFLGDLRIEDTELYVDIEKMLERAK
jgi:hypothetical protein